MFMDILVYFVAFLIVITKYYDCKSTVDGIVSPLQEHNPLARKFMLRYGIKPVVWTTFGFAITFVLSSLYIVYGIYDSVTYKLVFIILGGFIAIIQFAVVHSNLTSKVNPITRILKKLYRR